MRKSLFSKILILFILVFAFFFSPNLSWAISPPELISPINEKEVWASWLKLEWEGTGANFYKYQLALPTGELKEEVTNLTSKEIRLTQLGDYRWRVSSCLDAKGADCGKFSKEEKFTVISPPAEFGGGLVPCGRNYDDPTTDDIDESQPCGIKDIFLLFKNILDFLLWRVGPIILVLLALVAGVSSYFSFGSPTIIVRVKSILKSAITGYLIIFLAWIMINLILAILGFQVGVFGKWWQIIF